LKGVYIHAFGLQAYRSAFDMYIELFNASILILDKGGNEFQLLGPQRPASLVGYEQVVPAA
jgi:hypothetical protein